MLDRLAQETGGRFTWNTNDLSLAFARAQRDQGCRYTLGFYLPATEADRPQRVRVQVLRDGLHTLTPTQYMFRSEAGERTNEIMAAFFAPEMFHTGYLRTHLFPLQPRDGNVWNTLVAVSFPIRFDDPENRIEVDFGAVLKRRSKTVHTFDRRMILQLATGAAARERRFMFLEPADRAPGEYRLTVVMADADGRGRPDSTRLNVEVPPIPKKAVLLVDPILGRPRDANIVVRGDGSAGGRKSHDSDWLSQHDIVAGKGAFEPILVQLLDEEHEVHARNKACLVRAKRQPGETTVERQVAEDEGGTWPLPSVPLALQAQAGKGRVMCQNLYEVIPDEATEPWESYEFRTVIEAAPRIGAVDERIPFAVVSHDTQAPETDAVPDRQD